MRRVISILLSLIIILNIISYIVLPYNTYALSGSYTQSLRIGIDSFPESYKPYLRKLQEMHPNWNFKAYYTGISWSEVTSSGAENACLKNTIKKIDLMDPAMLCICGRTGDPGYYCASSKTVNYYLDPRNSLTESSVFQFLDLSNSTSISRDVIANVVSGTYLTPYVDIIMEAANQSGVNPLHIVVTIFQELGKKSENDKPRAISGTVPGYEGLYNFYNYGATDGAGAVERGLARAREMGWTTPESALIGGAVSVLKNDYIAKGQVTKYFYKFDVVGNEILGDNQTKTYSSSLCFSHQYMTNVQDPTSQAAMLMEYFTNYGILNSNLTFVIPVYDDMPASAVSFPTTLSSSDGELYYIDTTYVTSLNVRNEAGTSIGKLTKNQIVAVQSIQNNKAVLKLKIATSRVTDSDEKARWDYEDRIVYLNDARYLVKCESTPALQEPVVQTAEIRIEADKLKMTPIVTVQNIKEKYPSAVIRKSDGTDITGTNDLVGTGYIIAIDGIEYTAIKFGDINGDGNIKASDYVLIKNSIMNPEEKSLDAIKAAAADINKDGNIKASDYVLIKNYIMNGTAIGID